MVFPNCLRRYSYGIGKRPVVILGKTIIILQYFICLCPQISKAYYYHLINNRSTPNSDILKTLIYTKYLLNLEQVVCHKKYWTNSSKKLTKRKKFVVAWSASICYYAKNIVKPKYLYITWDKTNYSLNLAGQTIIGAKTRITLSGITKTWK